MSVVRQVWPYTASMAHLHTCMEISLEGRGPRLGQLYDELCRRSWTEMALRGLPFCLSLSKLASTWPCVLAFAGDEGFCVKTQSELKDLEILESARRQSDEHRHTPATHASKGGGKGESSNHGAPRFNDRPWLYELVHLNSQVNATTNETTQREAGRRQAKKKETRKEAASAPTTGTNPKPRNLGRCASVNSMCMPLSYRLLRFSPG